MEPTNLLPKTDQALPTQHPNDETEVNLMDYFFIIWKRKISVLSIFCVIVAGAAVVNLLLPKTYQAEALVKVGVYKNTAIRTFADIKAIFAAPAVLEQIGRKLSLPAEAKVSGLFSIEQFTLNKENASFLTVKGRGDTPEKSLETTTAIIDTLLQQHQMIFNTMNKSFDMEIELIKRDQAKTEQDIKVKQQEISRINNDIDSYQKEIIKRSDIQSSGQGRIVESYINLLAGAKNQKESRTIELTGLKQKLTNFDALFLQKEFERTFQTKMTSIEVPPILPQNRIAPKRTQNVLISAILALFIGILYAFAAEFVAKYRSELQSTK